MKPVPMPVIMVMYLSIDIGKCGSDSWQVPELCNLVKRYPEMKFVACHLLAPSNKDKEQAALALEQLQLPNLWFDLSSVVHNCRPDEYPYPKAIEFIRWLRRWLEQKKLMFGTDFPSALKEDVYGHYVGYIADSTCVHRSGKRTDFYMKMLMECILIIIDAEGRKQK